MFYLPTLNLILATGSLVILAVAIVLYVDYFIYKGKYFSEEIKDFLWPAILIITTSSVVISLIYSEYFGLVPCSLCWLQRIAIYPQALVSIIAFKARDRVFFPLYGIGLSLFGLIVAVYHYIYQLIPKESLSSGFVPCLADGSNADCAVKIMNIFGFVTFPFISAATFLLLIILYLYMRKSVAKEGS